MRAQQTHIDQLYNIVSYYQHIASLELIDREEFTNFIHLREEPNYHSTEENLSFNLILNNYNNEL